MVTDLAGTIVHLAPRVRSEYRAAFARLDALAASGMLDHPLRLAHFLAQVCHETGGLTVLVERLNYRAARLLQVWPTRFRTLAEADPFAAVRPGGVIHPAKAQALANKVYGGRMGNVAPDDGWKYIGRGLLQITGRDHYRRVGLALGIPLEAQPALAIDPHHALPIALETWRASGCDALADANDVTAVTRRINGGVIGLADRKSWLGKAKSFVGVCP